MIKIGHPARFLGNSRYVRLLYMKSPVDGCGKREAGKKIVTLHGEKFSERKIPYVNKLKGIIHEKDKNV